MSWLKHILLVAGIVLMAMPCCHAVDLDAHEHDEGVAANICAAHSCQCHTCDQTDCNEDLNTSKELRTISTTQVSNVGPMRRLTPPTRQMNAVPRSARVRHQLISLKTIRLLI